MLPCLPSFPDPSHPPGAEKEVMMGTEDWENHHWLFASWYAESTANLSHHSSLSLLILSGIYNLENRGEKLSPTGGRVWLETTERWTGDPIQQTTCSLSCISCSLTSERQKARPYYSPHFFSTVGCKCLSCSSMHPVSKKRKPNKAKEGFINASLIRMGLW